MLDAAVGDDGLAACVADLLEQDSTEGLPSAPHFVGLEILPPLEVLRALLELPSGTELRGTHLWSGGRKLGIVNAVRGEYLQAECAFHKQTWRVGARRPRKCGPWLRLAPGDCSECEKALHDWLWYGAGKFGVQDVGTEDASNDLVPHRAEGNAWREVLYEGWGSG